MDDDDDGWVANPFAAVPRRSGAAPVPPPQRSGAAPAPPPQRPEREQPAPAPARGAAARQPRREEKRIYPESGEIFTLSLLYEDFAGEYTPEEIYDFWETQCFPLDGALASNAAAPSDKVVTTELPEAVTIKQPAFEVPPSVAASQPEQVQQPRQREEVEEEAKGVEEETLESRQEFFELGVGKSAAEEELPASGSPEDFNEDVRWRPERQVPRTEAMRAHFRTRVRARKDAARAQRLATPLEMPGRRKVLSLAGTAPSKAPTHAQMPSSGLQSAAGGLQSAAGGLSSSSRGPRTNAEVLSSDVRSAAAPPAAPRAAAPPLDTVGGGAPGTLPRRRRRPFAAALAAAGIGRTEEVVAGTAAAEDQAPAEASRTADAVEAEVEGVVEVLWEPISDERRQEAIGRLQKGVAELEDLEEDLRADHGVVLVGVRSDGFSLRHASPTLRADREVVLAAVCDSGLALQHAAQPLTLDREVVLSAVLESGAALEFAAEALRCDHEIALTALAGDPEAVRFAGQELMDSRDFVMAAVPLSPKALQYASARLRRDPELVLLAVERHAGALLHAAPELRGDYGLVYKAVSVNGTAIAYADAKLRRDPKILAAAVQNDPLAAAAAEVR